MAVSEKYLAEAVNAKGDLYEHLYTIKKYAEKCEHITELGVRWVISTWALLAAKPKTLNSFDLIHYVYHGVPANKIIDAAQEQGTEFNFYEENVLTTDKIGPTDLLFIDTLHSYKQVKLELELHARKVRKYIIITNAVTYGSQNEGPVQHDKLTGEALHLYKNLQDKQGVMTAVKEFLDDNTDWRVKEFFKNCNGLCVLERIPVAAGGLAVTGTSMSTTFTGVSNPAPEPVPAPVAVAAPVYVQAQNQNQTNKLLLTALIVLGLVMTSCAAAAAVYFAMK
jgi:hypothetical protein